MKTFFYNWPILMALHVCASIHDRLHEQDLDDIFWTMAKMLCGTEHAKWLYEHKFSKDVRKHWDRFDSEYPVD